MAIKIITPNEPRDNYDMGHVPIDLNRKTAVLLRQSKKKADKDHFESRLLQERLVPTAMHMRGETDLINILIFDEGAGISGTKGYDEREKLSALYLTIANDVVGSLFVARPDRLFRDKHFVNVSMFTELAEKKKLILVVPGKRFYDFTAYEDLKAFQKDMQDAYGYLATHVKYMNNAREQKVQRGLYGGSCLPAPYVIDRNAWKEEQVPLIYKPWLGPAIDLFEKFQVYDFSLSRIARYIESLPHVFPFPEPEDIQRFMFRTKMRMLQGGYTLGDFSSVKYYLSNLTLGGYAKVGVDENGNILLLPNAFDAAIPFELLDLSYAAIKGYHIDGTPFEGKKDRSRPKKNSSQEPHALFNGGFLISDQGLIGFLKVSQWGGDGEYQCFKGQEGEGFVRKWRSSIIDIDKLWTLRSSVLDRIVVARLCDLASNDTDMAKRVKEFFERFKSQEQNPSTLLDTQIKRTQAAIKRLDFLLTNPNIPLDEETAADYAIQLAELKPKLVVLTKKQQSQPQIDPETTIKNFYFMLEHLPREFPKQAFDIQRQIMRKLIKEIKINNISPHIFCLSVVWLDGVASRPDTALLWRAVATRVPEGWTEQKDNIIRQHYAEKAQIEILRLLPDHTWNTIRTRANALGAFRKKGARSHDMNNYGENMSYADVEVAGKFTANEEERIHLLRKIQELSLSASRGEFSIYWPLPVNVVGYSSLIIDSPDKPRPVQRRGQTSPGQW